MLKITSSFLTIILCGNIWKNFSEYTFFFWFKHSNQLLDIWSLNTSFFI